MGIGRWVDSKRNAGPRPRTTRLGLLADKRNAQPRPRTTRASRLADNTTTHHQTPPVRRSQAVRRMQVPRTKSVPPGRAPRRHRPPVPSRRTVKYSSDPLMSRPRAPAVYLSIYLSILIYLSLHPGFRYTLRGSGDFAILNRPTEHRSGSRPAQRAHFVAASNEIYLKYSTRTCRW